MTYLRNPTQSNHVELVNIRSHVQRKLINIQNEWWSQLATEIQGHADSGNQQVRMVSEKELDVLYVVLTDTP